LVSFGPLLALVVALGACGPPAPTWTTGSSDTPSTSSGTSPSSGAGGTGGADGSGGAESCSDTEVADILALTPDLTNGEAQFGKSCALDPCHGPDGQSGNAPDFGDVLPEYDDCGLMRIMLDGKKGMISLTMVFETDQDFCDALAYVRSEF